MLITSPACCDVCKYETVILDIAYSGCLSCKSAIHVLLSVYALGLELVTEWMGRATYGLAIVKCVTISS